MTRDMKKFIIYALALLAALSCSEKAEYDQTLGLLSEYNKLSASGGSTEVAVFSNTDWTVEMDRQVDWASIDRFGGHKSGYLVFDFEPNYGRARRVILVFKAGGQTRTLNMYQNAYISDEDCIMELGVKSITAPGVGMTEVIPFETNLIYSLDEMYLSISYPPGEEPDTPWIRLTSVERTSISIEIAPNTSGVVRTANVRLSHTDAGSFNSTEGDTLQTDPITIVQNP